MIMKKNTEAIVQISILSGIAMLLLYGMISKKVNFYVHPRFHAGIWVSIVILFVFSISLIPNIKRARHNVNINHYIIFAIPILTALIFSASSTNNMNMSKSNISSSLNTNINETKVPSDELADSSTANSTEDNADVSDAESDESTAESDESSTESDVSSTESDVSKKYAKYEADGIIAISDDMLQAWYDDLYNNLDSFVGKKCQYVAQVFNMDGFEKNEFLAGRYLMVCCAADLAVNGIMCESDIRSELKEGQWITVTGTIVKHEYKGKTIPMLTDVTITNAVTPSVQYIYYNY